MTLSRLGGIRSSRHRNGWWPQPHLRAVSTSLCLYVTVCTCLIGRRG